MRTTRSLIAPLLFVFSVLAFQAPAQAETRTITFSNFFFSPSELTIAVGDTVQWNGTFTFHPLQQVTGPTSDTPVSGGFSYSGGSSSFSQTFTTPGTIYYACANHSGLGMRGSIVVTSGSTPPTPTATAGPTPTACSAKPGKPTITAPPKGTKSTVQSVTLSWNATDCATSYKVSIKKDSKKNPIFKRKTTSSTSVATGKLPRDHSYFWSLEACNAIGCSPAASAKFSVKALKK